VSGTTRYEQDKQSCYILIDDLYAYEENKDDGVFPYNEDVDNLT